MKGFRLLSYNIMSGCFENYEQNSRLSSRFHLLQEAIKTIDADFVGLVDTFKWKETFSEERLKETFHYENIFLVDMEDTRVEKNIGVAVMTNLKVKKFNILRAYNRNYIETVLGGLNLYTCYFDDLSEDTRLLEADSLVNQIKKPAIIHGDLNTFSKEDMEQSNKARRTFERDNEKLSKKLQPIVDDIRRGEVAKLLKENGFIDAEKKASPTMPSKLFPAKVSKPFVRVDYVFHTHEVTTTSTKVHLGDLFDQVSDHYPLSTTVIV